MSIEVTMPRLSDTMESGTIVEWKVAVGDKVSSGDVVADVETDKATMELAVYDDGTIASIDVEPGQQVDVGTVIALLAEKGEDPANLKPASSAPSTAPAPAAAPEPAPSLRLHPHRRPARGVRAPAASSSGGGMHQARWPVVWPKQREFPPATIVGTGPSGRIIKRDVEAAMAARAEDGRQRPTRRERPCGGRRTDRPAGQASSSAITPIESHGRSRIADGQPAGTTVQHAASDRTAFGRIQDHHSALSSLDVFRHGSIDGDAKGPQRKVGRRRRQVVGQRFLSGPPRWPCISTLTSTLRSMVMPLCNTAPST